MVGDFDRLPDPSRVVAPASIAPHAPEIEAFVRAELERTGVAGAVVVRGTTLELHGSGTPVAIDLGPLVEQWPLLPDDAKARRTAEVARRLAAARAGGAGSGGGLPRRTIAIPVAAMVLGTLAAIGVFQIVRGDRSSPIESPDAGAGSTVSVETPQQALDRQARVCEAGRKRLYSGASLGPFDTEGWVAELWLARAGGAALGSSPELSKLVLDRRLAPAADETFAALRDGAVEIVEGTSSGKDASTSWRSVVLRFNGRYVSAFLDPQERPRFLAMSERFATAVGAEMAALYARCAHLGFHDMGAWFRGTNAPAAAASLVYAMGVHAEASAVDREALAAKGSDPLEALLAGASGVDAIGLGRVVGAQGGAVTNLAGGAFSVTFPSGGGTRATSASRTLARKMGIGVGSD